MLASLLTSHQCVAGRLRRRAPTRQCPADQEAAGGPFVNARPGRGSAGHRATPGDLLNSRVLETDARQAVAGGFSGVLLDFNEVTFIDASVVPALVRCWDIAAEHGCITRIVNPSHPAALILEAARTRGVLTPHAPADRVSARAPQVRRAVIGRQTTAPDPSVTTLVESAELANARAREVVERSRHLFDAKRPPSANGPQEPGPGVGGLITRPR
jgi:anti-anti-sigma regulatory factor